MKVTIVGTGFVGSSFAYRLLVSKMATEILLVDVDQKRAVAEADELNHSLAVENRAKISAGDYEDSKNSDFVVITAGSNQKPGETRLDLTNKNLSIFKQIIPKLSKYNPKAIYIVATNPMDVMTFTTMKYSGLDPKRVIGSGTVLDSSRFRYYLSRHFLTNPRDIFAHVIGEHGDSQVEVFSNISIKGLSVNDYCRQFDISFSKDDRQKISTQTREAAYNVIQGKGATYFAIASSLTRIVQAISRDEEVIFPVSSYLQGEYGLKDVYLSVPTVLNKNGAGKRLELNLSEEELEGLQKSSQVIKSYCEGV